MGFAKYFTQLFAMSEYWIPLVAILLVVILSFINWLGIEESAMMTVLFMFIEAGGLILVVLLGFMLPKRSPNYFAFNPSLDPMIGILMGAAVFYFALASEGIVSERLARVDKWRKTPYISVLISGFVAVLTILIIVFLLEVTGLQLRFGEVEYKLVDIVGKTSSLAAILAFIMVNVAVIVLRFTKPNYERHFTIPLNIGRFPLLPAISIALIVFFLAISFTDWIIWVSTAVVVFI
ncbi:MAG: hypothetical protein DRJ37_05880, partial [Thermoprotei archaeon]